MLPFLFLYLKYGGLMINKIKKAMFASVFFCIIFFTGCPTKHYSSIYNSNCLETKVIKYLPGLPNIKTYTSLCEDYRFEEKKLVEAINMFVAEYSEEFDVSERVLWNHLSGLSIEMSIIPRVVKYGYSSDGKLLKNPPVIGLALDKKTIWVEVKTSLIADSALIHELVHIVIWNQQGVHADPDHEGEEFSGWTKDHTKLIKRLKYLLLDLNI